MAYALKRSCNAELFAGGTDGSHKKGAPNRGGGYVDKAGEIEHTTCFVRGEMSGVWHGFNEVSPKTFPDGRRVVTPYTMEMIVAKDMENV